MTTMGRGVVAGVAGLMLYALAAGQTAPRGTAGPAFRIEPLASPAGADSLAPQLTEGDGRVVLSWIEVGDESASVKTAERTTTGWSAARTIVSGDFLMVNEADVPVVRALPGGTLAAAWLRENGGDGESYDLAVSRSTDGGRTWSAPVAPHRDGTKTQHGFASIFPHDGGFGVVWLDGRATAAGGSMALRAATFDGTGASRGDLEIDGRVCECCPLATATTAEGPLVVYRDRSADEVRDIAVSRLVAGKWTAPRAVHRDGWQIAGCPVNGPAVSAEGANVAVAWFTGAGGDGRAFVAFSGDAGRTFGAPIRVDDAAAIGRVQVRVLGTGSAAVAWIESADTGSQLRIRRIDRSGGRSASAVVAGTLGASHPRLARDGEGLVVAWAENTRGSTRVRAARAVPSR